MQLRMRALLMEMSLDILNQSIINRLGLLREMAVGGMDWVVARMDIRVTRFILTTRRCNGRGVFIDQ